jgi:hypothetical protein
MHYITRAEKDKAQMFAELNDLRAGVDHLGNEKVHKCSPSLERRAVSIRRFHNSISAAKTTIICYLK